MSVPITGYMGRSVRLFRILPGMIRMLCLRSRMRSWRWRQPWRRRRQRIHKKFNLNFERINSREGCKTNENGLQLISVRSFLDGDFLLPDGRDDVDPAEK